jgi:hypothetical protein
LIDDGRHSPEQERDTREEFQGLKRSKSADVCFEKNNYNFMVKMAVKKNPVEVSSLDGKFFDSKMSQTTLQ